MMLNKIEKPSTMEKDNKGYYKSVTENDTTKSLRVEQVENGFIITISKHGYKKTKNGEEEYFDETKKYISSENPLDKVDKEPDTKELMTVLDSYVNL